MKSSKFLLIAGLFFICETVPSWVYGQKSTQNLVLDWDGARPSGSCILCGDDYACSNGFGAWNSGKRTFNNTIPTGMILTNIQVNIKHACPGGTVSVLLNGQKIGSFGRSQIDCSCNSCFESLVSSDAPEVLAAYNFNGTNTIQVQTDSILICVDRAEVRLDYEVARTVQTILPNPQVFCPGTSLGVSFTATGEFPSGNMFRVELSNPSGQFTSPQTIGQSLSNQNTGIIAATIPEDVVYSKNYRIRIVPSTSYQQVTDNRQNLEIGDHVAPLFSQCPANKEIRTIPGENTAIGVWTPPTVTDNCSDFQVSSNLKPGDRLPTGLNQITYTATDEFGNTSQCSFEILVKDGRPRVTGFVLVDSKKDIELSPLLNGDKINLLDYENGIQFGIRALCDPDTIGSMDIFLDGPIHFQQIEEYVPYSIFGDFPYGDYDGFAFETGKYRLRAVPYTQLDLRGIQGFEKEIDFEVIREYRLHFQTDGNGSVSVNPQRNTFAPGAEVQVQAQPNSDYRFLQWQDENGAIVSQANPYSFIIQQHTHLKAVFEKKIAVTAFVLINADTNQEIGLLKDQDTLVLAKLPTDNFSIRALAEPAVIPSIRFELKGNIQNIKSENLTPYSLFGEMPNTDYIGNKFTPGMYTLEATPFYQQYGRGEAGIPLKISFTVVEKILPSIQRINLIDAHKDSVLLSIQNGSVIDLDKFDTDFLTLEARINPDEVKSVRMNLSGTIQKLSNESLLPFSLFGDLPNGDYVGRAFLIGSYQLEVTPFTEPQQKGEAGNVLKLNFAIVGTPKIKSLTLVNATSHKDIDDLQENEIISLAETSNLISFRANPFLAGSVVFILKNELGTEIYRRTENQAPFSLYGDTPDGKYNGWTPTAGKYSLTLIPYSKAGAQGIKGMEKTYQFELSAGELFVDQVNRSALSFAEPLKATPKVRIYPNPADNELKIRFDEAPRQPVYLDLRDNLGALVYKNRVALRLDQAEITLNLDQLSLSDGMYHIRLSDGQQVYLTDTFIKE
ncbi:MAG: HYR domain-containing protein [Microscillaceae bacterium]|nr:HYR domain-containing protein [Microscillaceae bacterium]